MHTSETGPKTSTSGLYETDFYAWTQEQAQLLRNRQFHAIDLENLIEEVESLGKQERRELENRLSILIGHLLKWEYQPERRSRSWLNTIRVQRFDIGRLLKQNPSLKPYLAEAVEEVYFNKSVALASGETDLPKRTFPAECLYTLAAILDEKFYPGETGEWESELAE
ncbi:DUF29 domain-containing protein [Ancylothrix sp. C2]|uniref:DUF29 domain-containing protein n=1 Tax=Ancylothrix sp. D3o TaxID=2953691 RepID=UPI0021BB9CE5|nr:DUF29 domain-containing protein [Ancylothrix sp. D3o]MCT7951029.1 DUF29 domain-containing protein [Ancylothrix sp. D3o]